jgi:hypothetical protein
MIDSTDELLRKIRLGEDSVLELKAVRFRGKKIAGPERDDLADELAAMANTSDGVCVLGVDDKTRTLLARIPVEGVEGAGRHQYFMERRGDGVPIILNESLRLSGRLPEYRLLDDAELLLTIYSAELPNQFPRIIELDHRP